MDPFKLLKKSINGYSVDEGASSAEFSDYIDTGSYILNGLLSGKLREGGWPNNKALAIAGDPATGKTFFLLAIGNRFLKNNEKAGFMLFETEAATTKDMMEDRGIDTSRTIIKEPLTVQEFRTDAMKFLEAYLQIPKEERPPFLMALDSLGNLSTNKEIKDISEGSDTKDMTRQQLLRGTFRALRLKLAQACVPLIVTNHTYSGFDQYSGKEMGGGGAAKYASDAIIFLSKKKYKEGDVVIGNVIHVTLKKSRLTRENRQVDVLLTYQNGLDRYYGLFDLGKSHGIFVKEGMRWKVSGTNRIYYKKQIDENPQEIYDDELMIMLENAAKKEFLYGEGEFERTMEDLEKDTRELLEE